MRFHALPFAGAFVVSPVSAEDVRGCFIRHFDACSFEEQGLCVNWALVASAVNTKRGTLRGLHFQYPSAMEAKLVRCTRGSLWDVIVDLREGSPTRYQWHAEELSRKNGLALYIPTGFGHGYLSLEDDSEAEYLLSAQYSAELANGLRWNDPALGIDWPFPPMVVSERDQSWPYLRVEP